MTNTEGFNPREDGDNLILSLLLGVNEDSDSLS